MFKEKVLEVVRKIPKGKTLTYKKVAKRVEEGIKGILDELKRIRDEEVDEKELRKAKNHIVGNMYLRLESSDSLANFYGAQEILKQNIETPKEMEKEIKKITTGDIAKVAKSLIRNDRLNMAIVGKYKDDRKFKNILKV